MAYIDETYGKQLEEALRGLVSRPALGQPWFGFHASEVPAGVLLFTATTHSRVLYADFWSYIQNKNLVKTEEEWQTIYNERGWCPFYSDGDGIDTFRMPILEESEKLVGIWAISAPQQPIPDATIDGIVHEIGLKANANLDNLSSSGKSLASGWGMPLPNKEKKVILTIGATGTQYTAPSNGWFEAYCTVPLNKYIILTSPDGGPSTGFYGTATVLGRIFLPVSKGARVQFNYSITPTSNDMLIFWPAVGEDNDE